MRHLIPCTLLYRVFIFSILFSVSGSLYASQTISIAKVIKLRGEASQLPNDTLTATSIKIGDQLKEDTSIVTKDNSFVQLTFTDGSLLSIGPNSHVAIVKFDENGKGVLSLLKGQIRNKVIPTVNENNKLIIKTRTAALGVRGTEFQTIYNPQNEVTNLLTFDGKVAIAKSEGPLVDHQVLDGTLKSKESIIVEKGKTSITTPRFSKATRAEPVYEQQFNALYKNEEMKVKPSDLSSNTVELPTKASGLVVDINTGLIVPSNINKGKIDLETGSFIPPEGLQLDATKGFIVSSDIKDKTQQADLRKKRTQLNRRINSLYKKPIIEETNLKLFRFRLSGVGIFQTHSKTKLWTSETSWNPTFSFDSNKAISAKISTFPIKNANNEIIWAYTYALVGSYDVFDTSTFELGFGRQGWGKGNEGWEYLATYSYKIRYQYISSIVASFTYFDQPSYPYNPALEFGAGVEFSF